MGLDQYLYKAKKEMTVEKLKELDRQCNEDKITEKEYYEMTGIEDIGYWRKHNALQAHCEDLWRKSDSKNKGMIFNCEYLELNEEEIINIIKLSENNEIIDNYYTDKENERFNQQTVTLMKNALEELKKGYKIFYSSWW